MPLGGEEITEPRFIITAVMREQEHVSIDTLTRARLMAMGGASMQIVHSAFISVFYGR